VYLIVAFGYLSCFPRASMLEYADVSSCSFTYSVSPLAVGPDLTLEPVSTHSRVVYRSLAFAGDRSILPAETCRLLSFDLGYYICDDPPYGLEYFSAHIFILFARGSAVYATVRFGRTSYRTCRAHLVLVVVERLAQDGTLL